MTQAVVTTTAPNALAQQRIVHSIWNALFPSLSRWPGKDTGSLVIAALRSVRRRGYASMVNRWRRKREKSEMQPGWSGAVEYPLLAVLRPLPGRGRRRRRGRVRPCAFVI
jgi:hypothetical protein